MTASVRAWGERLGGLAYGWRRVWGGRRSPAWLRARVLAAARRLCGHPVPVRISALLGSADVRPHGAAAARRLAVGLGRLHVLLPGDAAGRLLLRASGQSAGAGPRRAAGASVGDGGGGPDAAGR